MSKWEIACWVFLLAMILFNLILTVVTTIGGVFDLRYLFKKLNEGIVDETDDGRVEH